MFFFFFVFYHFLDKVSWLITHKNYGKYETVPFDNLTNSQLVGPPYSTFWLKDKRTRKVYKFSEAVFRSSNFIINWPFMQTLKKKNKKKKQKDTDMKAFD